MKPSFLSRIIQQSKWKISFAPLSSTLEMRKRSSGMKPEFPGRAWTYINKKALFRKETGKDLKWIVYFHCAWKRIKIRNSKCHRKRLRGGHLCIRKRPKYLKIQPHCQECTINNEEVKNDRFSKSWISAVTIAFDYSLFSYPCVVLQELTLLKGILCSTEKGCPWDWVVYGVPAASVEVYDHLSIELLRPRMMRSWEGGGRRVN